MEEAKPSAPLLYLLYPNITSISAQYINDKILAKSKFYISNNINIIKDIRN